MGNKLKVEIIETVEELKQQLKHQKKGQEKERLQMLYWLKSGQVKSRQELALRLARNESIYYITTTHKSPCQSRFAIRRCASQRRRTPVRVTQSPSLQVNHL